MAPLLGIVASAIQKSKAFSATGGQEIRTVGGYKYHIFTTVGSNTFTASANGNVEVVVVGAAEVAVIQMVVAVERVQSNPQAAIKQLQLLRVTVPLQLVLVAVVHLFQLIQVAMEVHQVLQAIQP